MANLDHKEVWRWCVHALAVIRVVPSPKGFPRRHWGQIQMFQRLLDVPFLRPKWLPVSTMAR